MYILVVVDSFFFTSISSTIFVWLDKSEV